jgi:hypothetical protein
LFDLTKDPENPQKLSTVPITLVNEVRALNGVACVAAGEDGAVFIGYEDPRQPKKLSTFPLKTASDVELHEDVAFVSDSGDGAIVLLDISEPAAPRLVSRIEGLNCNTIRMSLSRRGDRELLFVAEYGACGMRIFDVTDRTAPVALGRWSVGQTAVLTPPGRVGNIADVAVEGNLAVVSNFTYGIQVLDVADTRNLRLLGEARAAGEADNVRVIDDGIAAVEDFCQTLLIMDARDADHIAVRGQYHWGGRNWPGVMYRSPYFYVSGQFPAGIATVDLTDPFNPRPVHFLETDNGVGEICMRPSGQYALIASRYGYGIRVLDLTKPDAPKLLSPSRLGTIGPFPDIDVTESLVVAACEGLAIYDATVPERTHLMARIYSTAGSVAVRGDIAFCSTGEGLEAVDISNPIMPRVLARLQIPGLGCVRVRGGYLYALEGNHLAVFRLPDWPAASPEWAKLQRLDCMGTTDELGRFLQFDVRGDRLYCIDYNKFYCISVPWSQAPLDAVSIEVLPH